MEEISLKSSNKNNLFNTESIDIEWLVQLLASMCWIISMIFYGLNSTGDYFQLAAASAWFIANIANLKSKNRNK